MNFQIIGNDLILDGKTASFNYSIYKAEACDNLIIVLLEFKKNNSPLEFNNELYAVSYNGHIVWKMEDARNHLGEYTPAPLVDFSIREGKLFAFDYYARKYIINVHDGSIAEYRVGRW